ncbi:MAG: GGDEF domain-containing protein [Candidatus Gracilibacteria bacterium]|nr:GGDEF domain-containing protein [Candidatus Gracilibacteria bacterium]MDD3120748.1 GGDEF domain-containing protein [Candidatus Gracilibacteria bacterium]MDD4530983.1 GGDEF domain-containing protein [Candidatus Gracilibacteria bacterium]
MGAREAVLELSEDELQINEQIEPDNSARLICDITAMIRNYCSSNGIINTIETRKKIIKELVDNNNFYDKWALLSAKLSIKLAREFTEIENITSIYSILEDLPRRAKLRDLRFHFNYPGKIIKSDENINTPGQFFLALLFRQFKEEEIPGCVDFFENFSEKQDRAYYPIDINKESIGYFSLNKEPFGEGKFFREISGNMHLIMTSIGMVFLNLQNSILKKNIYQRDAYIHSLETSKKIDELTLLLRKFAFFNALLELCENQGTNKMTMMMFDIDDFKKVNDEYGHNKGDEVLALIGAIMREIPKLENDKKICSEDEIILGRYGGEEFFIGTTVSEFKKIIKYIQEQLEERSILLGLKKPVTVSIGVVKGTLDKNELQFSLDGFKKAGEGDLQSMGQSSKLDCGLFKIADILMYIVKKFNGKNGFEFRDLGEPKVTMDFAIDFLEQIKKEEQYSSNEYFYPHQ